MGNDIVEIRAHLAALIAADKALLEPVRAQIHSAESERFPEAQWALRRVEELLATQVDELCEHVRRLGGDPHAAGSGESLATDLLHSAARSLNAQTVARSLRNYYTALSLAHSDVLLLETTARARGYSSTAALARRHREEINTLLLAIRDLLPSAVKEEIAELEVPT